MTRNNYHSTMQVFPVDTLYNSKYWKLWAPIFASLLGKQGRSQFVNAFRVFQKFRSLSY